MEMRCIYPIFILPQPDRSSFPLSKCAEARMRLGVRHRQADCLLDMFRFLGPRRPLKMMYLGIIS